ncbi:hypothetical protein LCGC14_1134550 [marine sediment metagenome]|uniref:Uncharacterized protein n=1 Tax=marine sediment metagenome TaxID=412755 RepID=A0A0F9Q5W1_9ZZZZ
MASETTVTVNFHLKQQGLAGKVQHLDTDSYTLILNAGRYQGITIFLDKKQAAPAVGVLRALAKELEQLLIDSLGIPAEEAEAVR